MLLARGRTGATGSPAAALRAVTPARPAPHAPAPATGMPATRTTRQRRSSCDKQTRGYTGQRSSAKQAAIYHHHGECG